MTQSPTQISNQLEAELGRVDPDAFADDLKPGTQLLGGHYTIIGFLNSGGFGITYLAKDSLDRTVVIKECFPNTLCRRSTSFVRARSRKHQSDFRGFVDSFLAEAKSLARLVHPNIVGVHQVFEDNDTAYMAIDYIDGRDLHDILNSTDRAFTPDQVIAMLKKMLSAVEFIHQVGILHRDISPDNILVDKAGNPILIDFGAASEQVARATRVLTGRRVIKEGYSPQEFYLTGAEQSPASDLYSLGATFYHVITGQAPPESQRRLARVAEGEADPYVPLAGRYEGYPKGFLDSIDKAVRVMPRDRIQSAGDWLDWIRIVEEGSTLPSALTDEAPKPQTRPLTHHVPARRGGLWQDYMGYMIGAGAVFVVAGLAALWSRL
ncbi:serine/threonine-protein kinase [Tabrizicola sp.]|uniref:serine/threonine-protein kinase n=1 Tax=Tabrizicola sp. TaxID=2005166 RepID=UPI0027347C48|nr:serine/threonine-protein kinase [Tabrizicola sp.]MDP3196791.1 serine/threonine-protein kinase [Tabrizicola sp.]